jgi:hypothetical protein
MWTPDGNIRRFSLSGHGLSRAENLDLIQHLAGHVEIEV